MTTVVYRYGCPARWQPPAWVLEQFRLAHELRHRLAVVEQVYEQRVRELWSAQPAVAAAEQRIDELEHIVAGLTATVAQARAVARSRTGTRPEPATALRRARADLHRARQARRRAVGDAYNKVKPALARTKADRKSATKATHGEFVERRGMRHALYQSVLAEHRATMDRVVQARKRGQRAELRPPRPWDGACTAAVAIHPRPGMDCSPGVLAAADNPWRDFAQARPWMPPDEHGRLSRAEQRRLGQGEVTVRLAGEQVTVPVQVHRMLPGEAQVTEIRLVRRRVGVGFRHHVCVTARVPDPAPRTGGPTVAVHLVSRARPGGGSRVAVWAATEPLAVPPDLSDVVTAAGDRRTGEITLPGRWVDAFAWYADMAAQRSDAFERAREELATWAQAHPDQSEWTAGEIRGWDRPERLAAVAVAWRGDPPDVGTAIRLEEWRARDRHWAEWHGHGLAQATGRRDDGYRRVAAWLTGVAATVVVVKAADGGVAAVGRLRRFLHTAATRRGVAVVEAEAVRPSCPYCARSGPPRPGQEVVVCGGCGRPYDQDTAVARQLLPRFSGPRPETYAPAGA